MFSHSSQFFLIFVSLAIVILDSPALAIIGGKQSEITKEPWTVELIIGHNQYCGGSILKENFVLTAAKCVYDVDISKVRIHYGATYFVQAGEFVWGKKVFYDGFDNKTSQNNIAVVQTRDSMRLDQITSKSIELTDPLNDPRAGTEVLVSGWGDLGSESPVQSFHLMDANFTVVDRDECGKKLPDKGISTREFCAGGNGVAVSTGDEGDPAVQDSKLVGVASYGNGKDLPSVFTRVGFFVNWIKIILETN